MNDFESRLKGGHRNSLGNTIEVVAEVLTDHNLFNGLFECYFSNDEVVRLRVSNAMKRICKAQKSLLLPYIDRFLDEISKIDQPSTQWTLSQLFLQLEKDMTHNQKRAALKIMQRNLTDSDDWIVRNQTMETLGKWAKRDIDLKGWIVPYLETLKTDARKSVAKKADKTLTMLLS